MRINFLLQGLVLFVIGVLIAGRTEAQSTSTPQPSYLIGLARYVAQRGYMKAGLDETTADFIDIYYRSKHVETDGLGQTAFMEVAIPQWKLSIELRKADYSIQETGGRYYNKTFTISAFSPVSGPANFTDWSSLQVTNDEMLKSSLEGFARPLDAAQHSAILKAVLGSQSAGRSLAEFKFSKLYGFENVIWILDLQTSSLFRIESDGDLDDIEAMKGFGFKTREYRLARHDLSRAFLSGQPWSVNDRVAYGLFLCFANGYEPEKK